MTDMLPDDASSPLGEILALSASMLEQAQAQDWIGVANLEVTRESLLKSVFEGADRPAPEVLSVLVRQLLESDRKLITLGEQARSEFVAALGQLRQGRRAQAAYTDTGGG